MNYPPKILYNPSGKTVEFRCGGLTYIFKPGEVRNLEGFPAYHALNMVNTGLVERPLDLEVKAEDESPIIEPPMVDNQVDYGAMKWKQLLSYASSRGVKTVKRKKKDIIAELEELDG